MLLRERGARERESLCRLIAVGEVGQRDHHGAQSFGRAREGRELPPDGDVGLRNGAELIRFAIKHSQVP